MNYESALQFIHGASVLGSKLGLHNITELLARLGNPHIRRNFIHVAGTNGKGTTTSAIARILMQQGYRVGIYTSPYVYVFNERISINGINIPDDSIAKHASVIKQKCEEMVRDGLSHPTEFEIVTALGFMYFAEKNCDFIVLEVGVGGRLDATNVIQKPLVSVITSISFDHMNYLGDTLPKIAAEKCGIIKTGAPVVVYPEQDGEVLQVIRDACRKKRCELIIAESPEIVKSELGETVFNYGRYKDLRLKLSGEHMAKNASTAIATAEVLREQGVKISHEAIYKGIASVKWPGRFEIIGQNPLFIIDGAHNISGIEAFKKTVQKNLYGKRLAFIMGMLKDKDYEASLKAVAGMADLFVAVPVSSYRGLSAEKLAEVAAKYNRSVIAAKTVYEGVKTALDQNFDAVLAFGSLYLLSEVKEARGLYYKQARPYESSNMPV